VILIQATVKNAIWISTVLLSRDVGTIHVVNASTMKIVIAHIHEGHTDVRRSQIGCV
jgi:hypothetical protein